VYPLLSRRRSEIDENKQYWPPLGLAYIAAFLERGGHAVRIIDRDLVLRQNGMDFDKVDEITLGIVNEDRSDIIGISATTPNMSDVNHLSSYIKSRYGKAPLILGGPHPTGEPELSLTENPAVDIVVRGEGELIISDIAARMDLKNIKGITYRSTGGIISNMDREPINDIDSLPMPARHLLDMKFYTRPSRFTSRNLSLRTTSIFTARGCPYRCTFCAGPIVFNGRVRFHSTERIVREIDELVHIYNVEGLYFAEDMFLSSKKRAEELLTAFIDNGINKRVRWMAQAKANIITEELLALMKNAGCVGIEYGFESGSQRVLDLMNKRLDIEESVRAADLTRKARLRFQANIIVGYPGEREEDFRKTISFIKKIKPNMVGFNLFMPLPGTASYEKLKKEKQKLPKWDDIGDPESPQLNYADMPRETFERLYLDAKLGVILPLNLKAFIIDNAKNPFRLLKIAFTQFGGVIIKTGRAMSKLRSLSKDRPPAAKRVLFISYNGVLEPILPSQAIPYMREIAKEGYRFILVSYEKDWDVKSAGPKGIEGIRKELESHGIEWRFFKYHKYPPLLSTIFDLTTGAFRVLRIIRKEGIDIVHVRGVTPGIIMIMLSGMTKAKVLFDMRGLLAEEYVGGGIWKEGDLAFRIVKSSEKRLLKTADAVTVLTHKHFAHNKGLDYFSGRPVPAEVIPCCVDMKRFNPGSASSNDLRRAIAGENNFVLMYPGKIGTFYLVEQMLDFFKVMVSLVPGSMFLVLTGDNTETLLKESLRRGIGDDKIRIISGVKFDDMPGYMQIADAGIFFINPYKKIGSSPIKMGEFLASGVPVIINPGVGDTENIVRDNRVGVVIDEFKEDAYRKGIEEIVSLRREGDRLKQRCRDTAQKYLSLNDGVRKYVGLYKAMLGAGPVSDG
jgi:radical SAM superfamily enzyme YgiQ (UPF0313 family)